MKKLIILFILILIALVFQPVSNAEIIEKSKPGYVWFSECTNEKDLDCIESLGIIDDFGKFVPGRPTGFSSPSYETGSIEKNTRGYLDYTWKHPNETWELPGLTTEYKNSYVITEFSLVTGVGKWYDPVSKSIVGPSGVNSMRFALLAIPTIQGFSGNMWGIPLENFNHNCVTQDFSQEMICQRTANFLTMQKIQAKLRFSWYRASQVQSNLRDNTYTVEELGNGATRVTVSGRPMERPYFVDSPTLNRDVYTREQADSLTNQWEIMTTDSSDGYTPNKCKDTGLPIVTGNMFSQAPPVWNSVTGDLSVNVWAPHLDPSGAVYKGYYEGNFTKEYIACLWGMDVNKISDELSVSVTEQASGVNQIVSTSIVQSNKNVRLVATGFHYSRGEIKFRRSLPTAAVKKEADTTLKKTTTITCAKGKTSKKVTAVKPKCPSGYKTK